VLALDAAQPFDFEHRMQHKLSKDKQLTIGIVGFGTFGQFLAKRFVQAGHRCVLCDNDYVRQCGVAATGLMKHQ
jgi:arogenate dehydrogenase (NADP+)